MKPIHRILALIACGVGALAKGADGKFPDALPDTEAALSKPMSGAEAAARVKLPPGFRCTLFAGEPDVRQPIAMTTDPRGRLWVAENYTYSESSVGFHPQLRDRIVIFEDADNDGHFDKRTVFWDGAKRLTSIEIGNGGVWALCLPELVFIPDKNSDDIPDGPPEPALDGFDFQKARHTVANGLRWGPDGWLYGRQGILAHSLVGKPSEAKDSRTPVNAGIWRFHPSRRAFEVVAVGTTNPWGMDWDAKGEAFFINTVIGHLWHVIPGAHYRRMFGDDPQPRIYEMIDQHADHVHWATGEIWTDVRKEVTDSTLAAGGGHAHTGLLVYQGGQWPAEWTGKLLTLNFHGRRFNVETMERKGSGFVGKHGPDAFLFADPWFRGIDLIAAPDGGVFVSDWSDAGECHDHDGIHRNSGRIYKISYGQAKARTIGDLSKLGGGELAKLQLSGNDWLARQSRRVLAGRENIGDAKGALVRILENERNAVHRLRALWALHVSDGVPSESLTKLLSDPDENVRAWAIRLTENSGDFAKLAANDPSALVRLSLASHLQKIPPAARLPLAAALLSRAEDAGDHNLPLMLWYGVEPIAGVAGLQFEKLIADARIPLVQRLGARRLAEEIDSAPSRTEILLTAISAVESAAAKQAVLDGVAEALAGRRKAPKPESWDSLRVRFELGASESLRRRVRDLSALFGDGRALDEIRAVALNETADLPQRRAALQTFVESRGEGLRELCEKLLPVRDLTAIAAAGLALSDDPAIADRLLAEWPHLYGHEKAPVMAALVSRPAWSFKVLDAIASGKLRKRDLGAFQARQIRGHNDSALTKRLSEVWGEVAETNGADLGAALVKWKQRLTPANLANADPAKGRAVYQMLCAACHKLNGEGGAIGPDLTGSDRGNLDYLLENILNPSAIVPDEYRQSTITMKDGRQLAGVIRSRSEKTLSLQTFSEILALEVSETTKVETATVSLMPAGLLDAVSEEQARDLIAYLKLKK